MKNHLILFSLLITSFFAAAQNKNHKFAVSVGAHIQHYNGNLGSSFFKFRTTCFGGGSLTVSRYINKFVDLDLGATAGDYGYCQTQTDKNKNVSVSNQCPGCKDALGMGELRSGMIAANLHVRFKIANGLMIKESSLLNPYIFTGVGINRLSDNMKKQCVNVGDHISINAGLGFRYQATERISLGYNMAFGCFISEKVYNASQEISDSYTESGSKIAKRKDLYLQNGLFMSVNF